MKKTSKLSLKKITIASLTSTELGYVAGGQPIDNFTKVSVCAEQCCASDINAQCRTTR